MEKIAKEVQERRSKWSGLCDEKRGTLRRKEGDGNESTREKEERRWLDCEG